MTPSKDGVTACRNVQLSWANFVVWNDTCVDGWFETFPLYSGFNKLSVQGSKLFHLLLGNCDLLGGEGDFPGQRFPIVDFKGYGAAVLTVGHNLFAVVAIRNLREQSGIVVDVLLTRSHLVATLPNYVQDVAIGIIGVFIPALFHDVAKLRVNGRNTQNQLAIFVGVLCR